jgi:hypothetical protein
MSDRELWRMTITGWSPEYRAIIRKALLKAAADASQDESEAAVEIVWLIDEVSRAERGLASDEALAGLRAKLGGAS